MDYSKDEEIDVGVFLKQNQIDIEHYDNPTNVEIVDDKRCLNLFEKEFQKIISEIHEIKRTIISKITEGEFCLKVKRLRELEAKKNVFSNLAHKLITLGDEASPVSMIIEKIKEIKTNIIIYENNLRIILKHPSVLNENEVSVLKYEINQQKNILISLEDIISK